MCQVIHGVNLSWDVTHNYGRYNFIKVDWLYNIIAYLLKSDGLYALH